LDKKNPDSNCRWLIVENSPANSVQSLASNNHEFDVITGPPKRPKSFGSIDEASYHHGDGLNLGVSHVKTRFLLILDPDFFIVEKDWVSGVIGHMKRNKITFLGAPWHPSRHKKIRYFPCMHCLFIDLQQVDRETLDFSPGEDYSQKKNRGSRTLNKYSRKLISRLTLSKRKRKLISKLTLSKRRSVGSYKDTGWSLYKRYKNDLSTAVENLQPVYKPKKKGIVLDRILPDRYSLNPKRKGYYTMHGFSIGDFDKFDEFGWEAFMREGKAFGFHIRCFPKSMNSSNSWESYYKLVESILNQV